MEIVKVDSDLKAENCKSASLRMVRTEEGKRLRKDYESHNIRHGFNEHRKPEPRADGISNTITTVQKDNYLVETRAMAQRARYTDDGEKLTQQRGEIREDNISNALTTVQKNSLILKQETMRIEDIPDKFKKFLFEIDGQKYLIRIRKLTPRESWRLMGFSDADFNKAAAVNSNTQLYKQAGNSIVKDVLVAIFGEMFR